MDITPEPENKTSNKTVKTYAEQMAEALSSNREGMIKKVIHEEEERDLEKKNLSPESKKNKVFMVVSLVLTVLALGILLFFLFRKSIYTVDVPPQFVPIIFTDKTDFNDVTGLTRAKIVQTIVNEVAATEVKEGGIEGFYVLEDKKVVTLSRLMTLLKANLVLGEKSNISENFLLGVVHEPQDNGKDFFLLLKTRSFEDIFGQMRNWEPKMFADLYEFFGIDLNLDTNELLTKDFEDGIIQNKNARVLYDKDGKIALMYVFVDDNSILVTNTEDATREIILRLASSKIKK